MYIQCLFCNSLVKYMYTRHDEYLIWWLDYPIQIRRVLHVRQEIVNLSDPDLIFSYRVRLWLPELCPLFCFVHGLPQLCPLSCFVHGFPSFCHCDTGLGRFFCKTYSTISSIWEGHIHLTMDTTKSGTINKWFSNIHNCWIWSQNHGIVSWHPFQHC